MANNHKSTKNSAYTKRLIAKQSVWWKRALDVQRPYRWNIRRIKPGFVLDVGCGVGRNLLHLKGKGVGVDHSKASVNLSKELGLKAFTVEAFKVSEYNTPERFDSILLAHVLEHMTKAEGIAIIKEYLPLLKKGGKIILITPQEAGYRSDQTHVEFIDYKKLQNILEQNDVPLNKKYSFPFPRFVGKFFKYNEFIAIGTK